MSARKVVSEGTLAETKDSPVFARSCWIEEDAGILRCANRRDTPSTAWTRTGGAHPFARPKAIETWRTNRQSLA